MFGWTEAPQSSSIMLTNTLEPASNYKTVLFFFPFSFSFFTFSLFMDKSNGQIKWTNQTEVLSLYSNFPHLLAILCYRTFFIFQQSLLVLSNRLIR